MWNCFHNLIPLALNVLKHLCRVLLFAVADYVRSMKNFPLLEDKLSSHSFSAEGKVALFPAHLTPAEIHSAIKAGKVHQGSFQASRENFLEGQVNVEGFEKPVS